MEEQIKQNKKYILFGVIGIIILILVMVAYYFKFNRNVAFVPDTKNAQENSEDQKLKEANTGAINEAGSASVKPIRGIDKDDHYSGQLTAPVQIVVYEDFECTFCLRFYDTLKEVEKYFGDKVAIAFRHYPLTTHSLAVQAAIASECASEQGKFWEMYDKLFADNKAGNLNSDQYKKDAIDLKLDQVKFNKCLDTQQYKDKIQEQMLEARNYGVIGTPGSFINGEPLAGASPFEDYTGSDGKPAKGLKSIIESHLK